MTKGKKLNVMASKSDDASVENGVPCLTSLDTVDALTSVLESMTFTMKTCNRHQNNLR